VTVPIQIQHILCPIDFSETSRRALDHAVALTKWYHARLSVMYVHSTAMPVYAVSAPGMEAIQPLMLTDAERQQIRDRLDAEVAPDRSAAHVTIDTLFDEAVRTPEAILERARALPADLIVLGTHGRSGVNRLMLGSVAEKVLRQAGCPVMIVPPRTPDVVPREMGSIRRILCPVDFSSSSARALEYASSLARETHATLTVLHVLELPPDLTELSSGLTEYREARFRQARSALSQTVTSAVPPDCGSEQLILVGKGYREILSLADDRGVDLIAMGVQGRGAVDLMFFGSTTNHVVRQARCPVLTLRGDYPR
jgi:nucleotide-binding universal stress UspA family protein